MEEEVIGILRYYPRTYMAGLRRTQKASWLKFEPGTF